MHEQNPAVKRYLEQFRAHLGNIPEAERLELVREMESHIAEAVSAGQSVADVLNKLGPADRLAKAYRAELLLKSSEKGSRPIARWFAVAGVLATTSLPSLIIVPLLAGLGVGFSMGGLGAILAGIAALFMPWMVVEPFGLPYGLPQAAAVIVGVVLAGLGVLALWLLVLYLRLLMTAVRKVWSD